jgi:glyceraldehyde 3-phosphate dehydrogenase
MKKRIAINGFGRIGRLTLRRLLLNKNVQVVAINDLTDNATLAHLFKYDSAHGAFNGQVKSDAKSITIKGKKIASFSERDPLNLPWEKLKIDTVLECTGVFRNKEKANLHVKAGAKKVVLSAPAKSQGFDTVVLGVNKVAKKSCYLSNASCTTNCLAPTIKLIDEAFGIIRGSLTTTHAYTSDQRIQDAPHSDLRRARAAAQNIVPTSTGAAIAVSKVYPKIKGKLSALAFRVPVITGSIIELNLIVKKKTTVEAVNKVFKKAADGKLKGIIEYQTDPIVSADIIGNTHSAIFDSLLTNVNGNMVKVICWYDNEAGYSARLADLAAAV